MKETKNLGYSIEEIESIGDDFHIINHIVKLANGRVFRFLEDIGKEYISLLEHKDESSEIQLLENIPFPYEKPIKRKNKSVLSPVDESETWLHLSCGKTFRFKIDKGCLSICEFKEGNPLELVLFHNESAPRDNLDLFD